MEKYMRNMPINVTGVRNKREINGERCPEYYSGGLAKMS